MINCLKRSVWQICLYAWSSYLFNERRASSLRNSWFRHSGRENGQRASLLTAEGYTLGTLCVMDSVPRDLTQDQTEALRRLAHQVMAILEWYTETHHT